MSDALELRAWRFLSVHRVGALKVTHVTFINGDDSCRVNTPSFDGFYESAKSATFGEAAISLAVALGMSCAEDSDSSGSASDQDSSSVSTATRRSGESAATSPLIESAPAASTTAATGVEAATDGSAADG